MIEGFRLQNTTKRNFFLPPALRASGLLGTNESISFVRAANEPLCTESVMAENNSPVSL